MSYDATLLLNVAFVTSARRGGCDLQCQGFLGSRLRQHPSLVHALLASQTVLTGIDQHYMAPTANQASVTPLQAAEVA